LNSTINHVIVSIFAIALAFSALYVFSERDEITHMFYGSPRQLLIPPNSNATIVLGRVSDGIEWTPSFTVQLGGPAPWWNQSTSIPQPSGYNFQASLFVSVQVNKSAFALLEDSLVFEQQGNKTVDFRAYLSSENAYPAGPFEYKMEIRHIYQLKIGNYETSITNWNQTGPHKLITAKTNKTLQAIIGAPDWGPLGPPNPTGLPGVWASPSYWITLSFSREPNIYLVSGLGFWTDRHLCFFR
jgi:hypothetical protein